MRTVRIGGRTGELDESIGSQRIELFVPTIYLFIKLNDVVLILLISKRCHFAYG